MALTAVLSSAGEVWDDARTILLIVVIVPVAQSMMFDELVAFALDRAFLAAGFVFSVVVSETLLAALRVRMPLLFRVAYLALLLIFYGYPAYLTTLVGTPEPWPMSIGMFLFSSVGSIPLLLLIPAVRRGRRYLAHSGVPWQWPWYPLALFAVLATGVGLVVSLNGRVRSRSFAHQLT